MSVQCSPKTSWKPVPQPIGPAAAKHQSPKLLYVHLMTRLLSRQNTADEDLLQMTVDVQVSRSHARQ